MGDSETLRAQWIPRPGHPPAGPPAARVVGPGRLERGYRARIEGLEAALAARERRALALARELETSARLERGCQLLLDRLEQRQSAERGARRALEQRERRLLVLCGALQRDNELLRERLALRGPEPRALAARSESRPGTRPEPPAGARAARGRGWWRRLFGPRSRRA